MERKLQLQSFDEEGLLQAWTGVLLTLQLQLAVVGLGAALAAASAGVCRLGYTCRMMGYQGEASVALGLDGGVVVVLLRRKLAGY